jgi:hypothetical protein
MPSARTLAGLTFLCATLLRPSFALSNSVTSVPPLPAPSGTIVNVSTEAQLQSAVAGIKSNTTIVIAPGTYNLSGTLYINGGFSNVGIRGATNNRDDVVLVGKGMTTSTSAVPFGIWTGGGVQGVTIANLTIRDIYNHPIMLNAGTQSPLIYNVRLINAGQQFLKSNPDGAGGVNNGRVQYSVLEYTTTSRDDYTNGVDVHTGAGWTISDNLFRNLRAPAGALAGPAILMWNNSSNTIVERNTFIDCQREISLGLIDKSGGTDHSGGVAQNNFIYRSSGVDGDAAILVADSPNTKVLNNTILLSGDYPSPIEYRFSSTSGTVIANNILDGQIQARDGASGTVTSNYLSSSSALFVNAAAGDLHLKSTATAAIDKASATWAPTSDWDSEGRPKGAGPDLGADEYGGTTTTTPPPAPPTNLRIIR